MELNPTVHIPGRVKTRTREYSKVDGGFKVNNKLMENLDTIKSKDLRTQLANLPKDQSMSTVQLKSYVLKGKEHPVSDSTKLATKSSERVVKGVKIGNAALAGADLVNYLYSNRDNIKSAADVATLLVDAAKQIPSQVVSDAKAVANALVSGDYVTVGDVAYDYSPVPVIARTADTIADILGYNTNIAADTKDAVRNIVSGVSSAVGSAVDAVKGWFK